MISEAISLPALFHAIGPLKDLTSIHFPRASIEDTEHHVSPTQWPPNLEELHISGGLRGTSLPYFTSLPPSLKRLTIDKCTNLRVGFIRGLLETVGGQLEYLRIGWRMPKVRPGSLDDIFSLVPNVSELDIAMEYLGVPFYEVNGKNHPTTHPVQCITFDSSPEWVHIDYDVFMGQFLFDAVANGKFHSLRTVRITRRALRGDSAGLVGGLEELGELLEDLERAGVIGRGNHDGKGGKAGFLILE